MKLKRNLKRAVSMLLVLLLLAVNLPVYAAGSFAGGTGTKEDPYQIKTVNQLKEIRYEPAAHYILIDDLTLSSGTNWEPIKGFSGTFDGNNHTISGLYLQKTWRPERVNGSLQTSGDFGLFADVSGQVCNLILENVNINMYVEKAYGSSASIFVGAIAGKVSGKLRNCRVSGTIRATASSENASVRAAGIAGRVVEKGSELLYCYNDADVYGIGKYNGAYALAAGITTVLNGGKVTNCTNKGKVDAEAYGSPSSGGIVGNTSYNQGPAEISHCYNLGTVKVTCTKDVMAYAGGIVSEDTDSETIIKNCGNFAEVTASAYQGDAGGIAAKAKGNISECFNTAAVNSWDLNSRSYGGHYAGGITAYGGKFAQCYNVGPISSSGNDAAKAGGITTYATGNITDCYNAGKIDINESTTNHSAGGIVADCYSQVMNCYNTGLVVGTNSGAIANRMAFDGIENPEVKSCYYLDNNAVGVKEGTSSYAVDAKSCMDTAMKTQNTFKKFDFNKTWSMGTGSYSYPILKNVPHVEPDITAICSYVGHSIIEHAGKDVTCEEDGWAPYHTCFLCDYNTYKEEKTQGHLLGEWITQEQADCYNPGLEKQSCQRCDYYDTRVVEPYNHKDKITVGRQDSSCTEVGYESGVCCELCQLWLEGHELIPMKEHQHGEQWQWDQFRHWKSCSCGDRKDEAGHSFGEWTVTKEANQKEAGEKQRNCSVCQKTETEPIPYEGPMDEKGPVMTMFGWIGDEIVFSLGEMLRIKSSWEDENEIRSVTAFLTEDKNTGIARRIELWYDATGGYWTGSYIFKDTDQNGKYHISSIWAEDEYGNISQTYSPEDSFYFEKNGHVPGTEYQVVEKASCTQKGLEAIYCTICGEKTAEQNIPLKPHNYVLIENDWDFVYKEMKGQMTISCTECSKSHFIEGTVTREIIATTDMSDSKAIYTVVGTYEEEKQYTFTDEKKIELTAHGQCGENAQWILTDDGILIITGSGSIMNTWSTYEAFIQEVILQNGVIGLPEYVHKHKFTVHVHWDDANRKCDGVTLICSGCEEQQNLMHHVVVDRNTPTCGEMYKEIVTVSYFVNNQEQKEVREYDIAVKEHSIHHDVELSAGCTSSGLTEGRYCTECGEVFAKQEPIEPLGHDMMEWTIIKEPNEIERGERARHCSRCDYKETEAYGEIVDKIPPILKEYILLEQGKTLTVGDTFHVQVRWEDANPLTLVSASYSIDDNAFGSLLFTYNSETNLWESSHTLTSDEPDGKYRINAIWAEDSHGNRTEVHLADGHFYVETNGHMWGTETTILQYPTCKNEGKGTRSCMICRAEQILDIPALEHHYPEIRFRWTENYESCDAELTCSSCGGIKVLTCSVTQKDIPATEIEPAKKVYTAAVQYQGMEYRDEKTILIIEEEPDEGEEPDLGDDPDSGDKDETIMLGDVNEDGTIDMFDAVLILDYYVGNIGEEELNLEAADVDRSASVDMFDAVMILDYYVGNIEEF